MMTRKGLLHRLLRVVLACLLPVFLLHVAVQVASDVDIARQRAESDTLGIASATLPLLQSALVVGDLSTVQETLDNIMRHGHFSRLQLVDRNSGALLADGNLPPIDRIAHVPGWFRRLFEVHFEMHRFPVAVGGVDYGVLVAEPSATFVLQDLWWRMWVALGLWLATAGVLAFFLKRALQGGLRPLHALTDAVTRFGEGDLASRAPLCEVPELAATAEAFNRMAGNLAEAQDKLETRVRQRTAELAAREAHTTAILNSLHDAVVQTDREGVIHMANPAAGRIFGRPPEGLAGVPLGRLMPRLLMEDLAQRLTGTPAAPVVRRLEMSARRHSGESFPAEFVVSRLTSDTADDYVFVLRDVSEQRDIENAREAARIHAEQLARAKGEFLANMSHEIRTPLNAILGFAQVGLRRGQGSPFAESFERILRSGELLLRLINDVLDFSKIEAHKLRLDAMSFALGEVIDRAVEINAARACEKGLDFLVVEDANLPVSMVGDPMRLTQILVNLLSNAIKFTDRGSVRLELAICLGFLRVRIVDSGVGMAPEVVERLFQAFEQADGSIHRRFGGTGLGLVISRRLVELMGGTIGVSSRPGHGTQVTVSLPLVATGAPAPAWPPLEVLLSGFPDGTVAALRASAPPGIRVVHALAAPVPDSGVRQLLIVPERCLQSDPGRHAPVTGGAEVLMLAAPLAGEGSTGASAGQALSWPLRWRHVVRCALRLTPVTGAAAVPRPVPSLAGLRILAAEDDPANRLVLGEILALAGAECVIESDGAAACARLEREGPQAFNLVVTDLQMPVMDGYATAREIGRLAPQVPVIGLSAHVLPEERALCRAAGMVDLLSKPVDVDALLRSLAEHAQGPRPALADAAPLPVVPGPETGVEGAPCVDWLCLETRFAGKAAFVDELAQVAGRTVSGLHATLGSAQLSGDQALLARTCHQIAGIAANIAAGPLEQLARAAESQARQGDPALRPLLELLTAQLEAVLAEIDARLRSADGDGLPSRDSKEA